MPLFHTDSQVNLSLAIIHYWVEGFTFAIKPIAAGLHFVFLIDFIFTKWVKITVKTMSSKFTKKSYHNKDNNNKKTGKTSWQKNSLADLGCYQDFFAQTMTKLGM